MHAQTVDLTSSSKRLVTVAGQCRTYTGFAFAAHSLRGSGRLYETIFS